MEENTTPPPERRCAACGATMPAEARFCGACGMESLPVSTDETAASVAVTPVPQVAPVAPVAPLAPVAPVAQAAPPAPVAPVVPVAPGPEAQASEPSSAARAGGDAEGRICSWCKAVNAPDAVTCASCGAVFPTPAGDEALERAAQARIQSMESELKQRKSGWWPFRSH